MRFIAADRIFDGTTFLSTNAVLVYDDQNLLKEVLTNDSVDTHKIQRYKGILSPGFINAHCHLELSHLRGLIPQKTTLPLFGPQVVQKRELASSELILECMQEAERAMFIEGVVAVGDISNTDVSFGIKGGNRLAYHTFIELIGFKGSAAPEIFERGKSLLTLLTEKGLKGSLAPHAPYSSSQELISLISQFDGEKKLPFCIHNQESEEETKFFMGGDSGFYNLYRDLKLDISWWKPPRFNSLHWYINLLKDHGSMLVHNTVSTAKDLADGAAKKVFWCLCPGANLYIEGRLPDVSLFKNYTTKICIGTDSLASNTKLSIVQEINHLLTDGNLSLEDLLRASTRNGAEALDMGQEFGRLIPGKNSGLLQLEFNNNKLIFNNRIL